MSDPDLAEQARKILDSPTPLDMPLIKGPYITLSEAFAKGDTIKDLANKGVLHPVMPALIGYPKIYCHQQEVFEAVKRGMHVLVSTGTGSGKTEAFLYPIVDDLLRQRDQGIVEGLTTILIYPMNALANDQLERLRVMLAGTEITFGQWIGNTPQTGQSPIVDRFEGSDRTVFLAERERRLEEARKRDRAARALAPQEECLSEEEIRQRKPRILITNYRQLEILTTRLPDVLLFADAPLRYLVFDEAHTYEGAKGAEVACLIRRIRGLAKKTADEVICIGTSATLTDPQKTDDSGAALRFASRFFGVDEAKVSLVGEAYVEREWPKDRYRPEPPQGDGMERLQRLLAALGENEDVAAIKTEVESLTGRPFSPRDDWRSSLFDHLIANDYVYCAARTLKAPQELVEGAWRISNQLKPARLPQGEQANAELLAYLVLGAAARKDDESLLRPKVHFFIRGLEEMVVGLDGDADATKIELYPSIKHGKEAKPLVRDAALFPVLVCRECGQHYFERKYENLEIRQKSGRRTELQNGNVQGNLTGSGNAWWGPTTMASGTRVVMTNRLLDEEDDDEESAAERKLTKAYLCRVCGALHLNPGDKCLADGCGHAAVLLPIYLLGATVSSCPTCGALTRKIGGRDLEPVRAVRAVTVSDVHILAQEMINAAPEGHRKLVVFADSRQDAAFQAGWIQDHGRRIRMRHMMSEIVRDAKRPLSLDELTDQLQGRFQRDRKLVDVLLPELVEDNADIIFEQRNLWIRVGKALEYMVLREFTSGLRKREVMEALGLARIDYVDLSEDQPDLIAWASAVGIAPIDAARGISSLLDNWRRGRMLYVRRDPIFSRYHPKDNPYLQSGLLPLRDFKPEGLVLEPRERNRMRSKRWRNLVNQKGTGSLQFLLRKWTAGQSGINIKESAELLWDLLTEKVELLESVNLLDSRGRELGDEVWQVNADKVRVVAQDARYRCKKCQRITSRPSPLNICMQRYCDGELVHEEPNYEDYNVSIMDRAFTMVSAEEHTAQVPGTVRAKVEQDFKSTKGRTNCLVATPTLELGVDIGALDMVLMRNVPPQSSNYWQRAGRAGRQERMAVITTYCRRANHDRFFFEDPLRLLSGSITAPAFNLRNPLMLEKHIRANILSELLLLSKESTDLGRQIQSVVTLLFPLFIRDYLLDSDDHFRNEPPATEPLGIVLDQQRTTLARNALALFAKHWPAEALVLVDRERIEAAIIGLSDELTAVLSRLHQRLIWARRTREELHRKKDQGLIDQEERQMLRRCDDFIDGILKRERSTYTLTVLSSEGFLPGYGMYEGGITASALSGFARRSGPVSFELSRSRTVALREFVPGNRLYANRGTFYVTRYHLAAETEGRIEALSVDPEKGHVAREGSGSAYGQSGLQMLHAMPIVDLDLAHEGRIIEDEVLRFAMPVLIAGRLQKHHRGGKAFKIGKYETHLLRGHGIQLVNLGEAAMAKASGEKHELGFHICSVCGAAKSPYVVPEEREHFDKHHRERCGKDPVQLGLSAKADVDMLLFHKVSDLGEGVNIGETLRMAATRILDMGQDDLELLPIPGSDGTLDYMIFDPMPGGSGLLDQMLDRWQELIEAANDVVKCKAACEKACYSCLKTYRNQFYHDHLDRSRARAILAELDHVPELHREIEPIYEEESATAGSPSNSPEAQLNRMLLDNHFPAGRLRESVRTSLGITTEPDWLHVDSTDTSIKVAIYLDGMSRSLHGDPQQQARDAIIRQALELDGYRVIVIQRKDLNDPEMMRSHMAYLTAAISSENQRR
ncbi:DEAD/DEAH box helicase [bacterium]|nr:DEAD/DEAH box helicase [bacterium]